MNGFRLLGISWSHAQEASLRFRQVLEHCGEDCTVIPIGRAEALRRRDDQTSMLIFALGARRSKEVPIGCGCQKTTRLRIESSIPCRIATVFVFTVSHLPSWY